MLIYARVEVSHNEPEELAVALQAAGADWLHVEDSLGEIAGAPQHVEKLLRILDAVQIPVQFSGGIRLLHIAEMVLGLGVSRIAIPYAVLTKTARAAEHFFGKLSDRCVAEVKAGGEGQALVSSGCGRFLYRGKIADGEAMQRTLQLPVMGYDMDIRNLLVLQNVILEGAVVEPALLLDSETLDAHSR